MLRLALILACIVPLSIHTVANGSMTAKDAAPGNDSCFMIDDSRTFIGIAAVKLSVGELKPEDGKLVGEYAIRVPLMKSKNDSGRIVLPLDTSIEELGRSGGTLRGKAYSYKKNTQPNLIVCEIVPLDGRAIRLAITTEDRTIQFESRYRVVSDSI